ncbi:hypothetical protein [Paenibacillus lactis]|uniref:hypothetical protein n=1 Tax=Paenibacillus lactis TaxID=228574 RepID=UPI003D719A70
MKTMYPAQVNSPGTELAAAIDATQDTIQVADGSVLPDAPNLLTIGTDEAAETILYTEKTGDELSGVTRGFQGTAQSWVMGTKVARYFTAYDHDTTIGNIGELSAGLNALGDETKDRFDIEQREDVVLNAGMQILNTQRNAAFTLGGIKGRTLVNLLGRNGGMESLTGIGLSNATAALDSTNKTQGINGLRVTTTVSSATNSGIAYIPISGLKVDGYYVLIADVKNGNAKELYAGWGGAITGSYAGPVTAKDKFTTIWRKNRPNSSSGNIDLAVLGDVNTYGYYDAVRIYEISATEYAALDTMTPEQIAAKYPYVDSVQPVRNPYAIRYGENLLPPFYEWVLLSGETEVINPYELKLTPNGTGRSNYVDIPVKVNETYYFSGYRDARYKIEAINSNGAIMQTLYNDSVETVGELGTQVVIPEGAMFARIVALNGTNTGKAFTFKSPMLTVGSTPKPFKPREDSMLALQTDLFAYPVTGANADEVFEKDGQYFKLAKWKKVVLDGTQNWVYGPTAPGYKILSIRALAPSVNWNSFLLTKFNGAILSPKESLTESDKAHFNTSSGFTDFYISVSNADSGWGDNYTPTADEIKAYFMGWKMYLNSQPDVSIPYNGEAAGKAWCPLDSIQNTNTASYYTTTLPTQPIRAYSYNRFSTWASYELVYQLAKPAVESIVSEGMLTFNEGDNQIEVGTGMVVREAIRLYDGEQPGYGAYYYTNHATIGGGSKWKYKPMKVFSFYRNSLADVSFDPPPSGSDPWYRIKKSLYDPSAAYSVTYLMLDKSPVVPFNGSYATNEKALLVELTNTVQQSSTAISALVMREIEEDKPVVWITPTLLNGWVYFGSGTTVGYTKLPNGLVLLKGKIKSGLTTGPALILPAGYRPKEEMIFSTRGYASGNRMVPVMVHNSGSVQVFDVNAEVHLEGVIFVAEQ